MKVAAIVQARTGSTRLPDKVLMPLAGVPVIQHVLRACEAASLVDEVILVTTDLSSDDELCNVVEKLGFAVVRGSKDNVLERYIKALDTTSAEVILRQTGDNPLLDPCVIDTVIGHFLKNHGCMYASNKISPTWPRGLDVEVVSREALLMASKQATHPDDLEHVTLYIRARPEQFPAVSVTALPQETDTSLRLTLDTVEDYEVLRTIFDMLYEEGSFIRVNNVIKFLKDKPHILSGNSKIQQKSNYQDMT